MNEEASLNNPMSNDPAPAPLPSERVRWSARIKRHLKQILWACAGIVVLLVVLAVAGLFWIDWLAKAGIEHAGTQALGVATTLDRIKIGLFSGNCTLAGFQVANPPGFKSSYFLRLDQGSLDMPLANLMQEVVEIDQLTLTGIHINLVRETERANFRTIMDNIRRFEAEKDKPEEKAADKRAGKKFIIHEVVIRDVKVNVDLLPIGGKLTQLNVPIEELRLQNVGSEKARGENLARITATVILAVLEAVISKGESILPPEMLSELTQKLAEIKPLETLRALRENLRDRREQRQDQADPDRPVGPIRQRLKERRLRREGT